MQETGITDKYLYKSISTDKKCTINTISIGNNIFANSLVTLILSGESAEYIRKLGLSGTISGTMLRNVVLTIDKRYKELCSRFNIVALPTIIMVAPGKAPIFEVGDRPEKIMEIIDNKLLK